MKILQKLGIYNINEIHQELIDFCLDSYKQAIILARENNIESEAIGFSRIGLLCSKVIRNNMKSGDYLGRCFDLAKPFIINNFSKERWYKAAINEHKSIAKLEFHREK